MSIHVYAKIFCQINGTEMELGSGKSLKISYISSVDLFSLQAVSVIWLWLCWMFLVQAFIFLFIAVAETMERLLIKSFLGGGEMS